MIRQLYERFTHAFFMPKVRNIHPGGRPPKLNKAEFGQITCVLRLDTIQRLKAGADSKHFGEFLQHHLDRYPPPSREQYLAMTQNVPYYTVVKRRKVPVIMASGTSKEARKLARERARRERLSPLDRAWEDSIKETVTRTVEAAYK